MSFSSSARLLDVKRRLEAKDCPVHRHKPYSLSGLGSGQCHPRAGLRVSTVRRCPRVLIQMRVFPSRSHDRRCAGGWHVARGLFCGGDLFGPPLSVEETGGRDVPYFTRPIVLASGRRYMSGNEAAAEAAIAAGCRFYAGYPITPSSEIMEAMSQLLPSHGGTFIQMEDELASISAVVGASWSGAKAMTATSGPGLTLMQECLGYAAFTETPVVVIDVQRAGPSTGQATKVGGGDVMTVKWGSHGDYQVVAFSPWSVAEMFSLTVEAFNVAERLRVPAFLLAEEAVGHLLERLDLPRDVKVYERDYVSGAPPFDTPEDDGVPSMPRFGQGENLLVTGSTHDGLGYRKVEDPVAQERLVRRLNRKILARTGELCVHEAYHLEGARLVVVAYGFTARSALRAVRVAREAGMAVGMLRLVTLWPFCEEIVGELAATGADFLVPEMNLGQVAGLVRSASLGRRVQSLGQVDGRTITPTRILDAIGELV